MEITTLLEELLFIEEAKLVSLKSYVDNPNGLRVATSICIASIKHLKSRIKLIQEVLK